jgi:hypothetical protein
VSDLGTRVWCRYCKHYRRRANGWLCYVNGRTRDYNTGTLHGPYGYLPGDVKRHTQTGLPACEPVLTLTGHLRRRLGLPIGWPAPAQRPVDRANEEG